MCQAAQGKAGRAMLRPQGSAQWPDSSS